MEGAKPTAEAVVQHHPIPVLMLGGAGGREAFPMR